MGRERIIERERRWAVPAAICALAPIVLYIVSIFVVQGADIAGGNSEAEQLTSLHEHASTVLLSAIVRGIGFLFLPIPMLYLFLAAKVRNPRVQAAMVGFVFLGPLLFGIQGVVQAVGAGQAASDFVSAPEEKSLTYPGYTKLVERDSDQVEKVTIYTEDRSLEVEKTDGGFYAVSSYPSQDESKITGDLEAAGVDSETDSDSGTGPRDAQATETTNDNGILQASQGLLLPAVLGLIVMMVYVSLQAMRAGLITRFLGSMGMALGASMILILPIAVVAMLAWAGFLGLLFVGKVPGGRPPAWDAGEAIPWQRPGEEPPQRGGDAIEGEATEVPEDGEGASKRSAAPRQKRKRKRQN